MIAPSEPQILTAHEPSSSCRIACTGSGGIATASWLHNLRWRTAVVLGGNVWWLVMSWQWSHGGSDPSPQKYIQLGHHPNGWKNKCGKLSTSHGSMTEIGGDSFSLSGVRVAPWFGKPRKQAILGPIEPPFLFGTAYHGRSKNHISPWESICPNAWLYWLQLGMDFARRNCTWQTKHLPIFWQWTEGIRIWTKPEAGFQISTYGQFSGHNPPACPRFRWRPPESGHGIKLEAQKSKVFMRATHH